MVLPLVAENLTLTWILFFCLTILHLFANFKAVSSLCFETLNKDRLILVLQSYDKNKTVKPPKEINEKENIVIGFGLSENNLFKHMPEYHNTQLKINIGVSFRKIIPIIAGSEVIENSGKVAGLMIEKFQQDLSKFNFSIIPYPNSEKKREYNILLSSKFKKEKLLYAYFMAYKMERSSISLTCSEAVEKFEKEYDEFEHKIVEAGWKIDQLQLNTQGFTGNFLQ